MKILNCLVIFFTFANQYFRENFPTFRIKYPLGYIYALTRHVIFIYKVDFQLNII
jgi:hypothetical protein